MARFTFELNVFPTPLSCVSLGDYHVYWLDKANRKKNPKFDQHCGHILSLKDHQNIKHGAAVRYFSGMLSTLMKDWRLPAVEFVVVPGHSTSSRSNGLFSVARNAVAELGLPSMVRVDALVRTQTIQKLAAGGPRSVDIHLSSMRYSHSPFAPDVKIVLDDVATSGNSLIAASRLIRAESPGATVFGVVFGRTADHD